MIKKPFVKKICQETCIHTQDNIFHIELKISISYFTTLKQVFYIHLILLKGNNIDIPFKTQVFFLQKNVYIFLDLFHSLTQAEMNLNKT